MSSAIRRLGPPLLAAAALASGALLGCGQTDEDKVAEVMRTYRSSIINRDYARACEQLAASAERELVEYASEQLPELGAIECASGAKRLFELTDELTDDSVSRAFKDAKVGKITVKGDTATAEVEGYAKPAEFAEPEAAEGPEIEGPKGGRFTETVKLRKVDGAWKIGLAVGPTD